MNTVNLESIWHMISPDYKVMLFTQIGAAVDNDNKPIKSDREIAGKCSDWGGLHIEQQRKIAELINQHSHGNADATV